MVDSKGTILVFGATGAAGRLCRRRAARGRPDVRGFVRDPSPNARGPCARRAPNVVKGDFTDPASMRAAMAGADGVFSVQPSSGQGALYNVSDEDEVRYGIAIADLAADLGIRHLVYSSATAAGDEPTGMGHFDSKSRIEAHVEILPIAGTIVRPSSFMEMLAMPGFGLPEGKFTFFGEPDQRMQLIAVRDIGRIVAGILDDPHRFNGRTWTSRAMRLRPGNKAETLLPRDLGHERICGKPAARTRSRASRRHVAAPFPEAARLLSTPSRPFGQIRFQTVPLARHTTTMGANRTIKVLLRESAAAIARPSAG